jgi:hypothetical protein
MRALCYMHRIEEETYNKNVTSVVDAIVSGRSGN